MSNDKSSAKNERQFGRGAEGPPANSVLDQITKAVDSIQYGEVRIIIQDHVIVQIDRVEKQRFR